MSNIDRKYVSKFYIGKLYNMLGVKSRVFSSSYIHFYALELMHLLLVLNI